jgi:hypothetical protein
MKENLMPAKKAAPKKAAPKAPTKAIRALYAVPIYGAIKKGDAAEMKKLAAQARKHISEVSAALADLDKKLSAKK